MNTNIIRKHFFFKGRVQGVGFRYRAQNAASLYSVTGWVKISTTARSKWRLKALRKTLTK